mmetsp:Transcript_54133/g.162059  ORF Transcript_54133/g.162059 Transcript_54133/m.162059 type:complete len:108 (+) Transcript_54133:295-618(+)
MYVDFEKHRSGLSRNSALNSWHRNLIHDLCSSNRRLRLVLFLLVCYCICISGGGSLMKQMPMAQALQSYTAMDSSVNNMLWASREKEVTSYHSDPILSPFSQHLPQQ